MLEVTSEAQETALQVNFTEIYKNSDMYKRNKDMIRELSIAPPGSTDLYFPTKYSQSFFSQCKACFWKQHLSYWRNPPYTAVRLFFTTVIALLFGTIFWDIGSKRYMEYSISQSNTAMFVIHNSHRFNFSSNAGKSNKIFSMQWDRCTPQYCS